MTETKYGCDEARWDLSALYSATNSPELDADMKKCALEASQIASDYRGKVAELDAKALYELVSRMETVSELRSKIGSFAHLNFATQVTDPEAGAFLQKITEFSSSISKELLFFDIEWTKVPDEKAASLISAPELSHYQHFLSSLRRYKPHLLSEAEERIIVEFSPVGTDSWNKLFDKLLADQRYGESGRTQEELLSDLYSPDREVRKNAATELTNGLRANSLVLTHVFNTILGTKMIDDRLRKYPGWLSEMNLHNELDDSAVNTLIETVTERYDMVERYYRLKRKLLNLDKLCDYDRYAPIEGLPTEKIDWQTSKAQVLSAFEGFSAEMAAVARRFFDERWIDAPVVQGKTSGAFAHPCVPSAHPYILVNYTANIRDVETVAHELGHGVHQVLAAKQGYIGSHTPLTFAETASVFAEMLVFQALLERLQDPKARLAMLCAKIESTFATVFRQIAMNRFEDALHTIRREKGELSQDEISAQWLATQKAMFRGSVELTDDYGVWWSYISHFLHAPGYVYAYAFGELLVLSLYDLYKNNFPDFETKYMELLGAGGSKTPIQLMEPFGIDLNSKKFWENGLNYIEKMIEEAERLAG